jgi:hypothetical protein
VSGYQVVQAATGIPAGIEIVGTLPCPPGKKATGGGWTTTDNNYQVVVVGSGPTNDGSGWTGGMYNSGTLTAQLTLTALCISAPGARPDSAQGPAPVFATVAPGSSLD